ncbi:MAG: hypothetical protein RRC07_17790, partial [Anaerolineae bacterium]|nr:hypothetical protein [Anaerolineae bacterium]
DLLGTSTFYNDPEVFPRYQLLESLNYYGGPGPPPVTGSRQSTVLLLGWSEEPYLEVGLEQRPGDNPATTFYILEIPVTGFTASGSGVEVPLEMLNWEILNESGMYPAGITNFYMPYGWVEFEYEPWPLFHNMDVTELAVVLQFEGSTSGQAPPDVSLWDWNQEAWVPVPDVVWGKMTIGGFGAYLGANNEVRIRLQNDSGDVNIRAVYPALSGNLE